MIDRETRFARRLLALASALTILLLVVFQSQGIRDGRRVYGDHGRGSVIRSDGLGYYAWLRSALIDGDFDFNNEFDDFTVFDDVTPPKELRSAIGRRTNHYPVGPALIWSLPVCITHLFVQATGTAPADGYSLPYQIAVAATGMVVAVLTLWLLYSLGRAVTSPRPAALAAVLIWFAGTPIYYAAVEPTMGHLYGTFAFTFFIRYWLRTFGDGSARRWFLLGLALGLVALMRWQLVTYAILPLGEILLHHRQFASAKRLALFGLGAALAFLPQIIAWKIVYGQWLVITHTLAKNWLSPGILSVLFSQDHGFFTWTPIAGLAFLATVRLARFQWPARLAVVGFAIQLYLIGAITGSGVYLGFAYGLRYLTEALVVFTPAFAVLVAKPKLEPWLIRLGVLLCVWNMILITAFRHPASKNEPWSNPIDLIKLSLK